MQAGPSEAEALEQLVAWFRRTVLATPFGEVGIVVERRAGQVTTTRRIHSQTVKVASARRGLIPAGN